MLIKKVLSVLIVIVSLLAMPFLSASKETVSPTSGSSSGAPKTIGSNPGSSGKPLKTIIVDNYYPYTFLNQKGMPDGFSVDLLRAVIKVMEMDIRIEAGPWDKAVKALESGEIDLLPMMAYSPERDRLFDFSAPHTIAYDAIFVRRGSSPVKEIEDLQGKTIIVMKKDAAHDYLQSIGMTEKASLTLVSSLPEALRLLSVGKGDAALMPKLVGLMVMNNLGLTNLEQSKVIDAYNRPFSFAVKEGHLDLLERLSQGLSIIKATGQYKAIYSKWFGALEPKGLSFRTVLIYFVFVVGIFILIGSGLFFWTLSLKKLVAQKTEKLSVEIEERKKVEESLRKSNERFDLAVRGTNDGIWDWDVQTGKNYFSPHFCELLGYGPDELRPDFSTWEALLHPDDHGRVIDLVRRHMEEQAVYDVEYRMKTKNGEYRWFQARGEAIRAGAGKPIRMAGSITDISERRLAEEQIQASLKEKEILLKEIHHRVKNNLAVISSILSLQSQYVVDKKSLEIFRECETRVRTMSLIHSKLYHSKDLARIDIGSYIRDLIHVLFTTYQVNAGSVSLKENIDPVTLNINTAIPLGLILNELISNSLKYAFPGGRIGVLEIGLRRENGSINLIVADDGVGIGEDFDLTKTSSLGLQLVQGLVQQLQGTIEMEKGPGTVFSIRFQESE